MPDEKFSPDAHLSRIKGKPYLEVKWRLVWFRQDHPDWPIITEMIARQEGAALFRADVYNDKGTKLANAHKLETKTNFSDYIEKAETGAIGRALALIGYGTQFSPELEEGERIVDAPVDAAPKAPSAPKAPGSTRVSPAQVKLLHLLLDKKGRDKQKVYEAYRITSLNDLSKAQASQLIDRLNELEDEIPPPPERPPTDPSQEIDLDDIPL